jgi:enterochelin esterase-like enzyme
VHKVLTTVRARLRASRTFIAFYVGRSDWRFYAENETLNQELSENGVAHVFRAYPGGHDQRLWQRYAAPWLKLALVHLTPAH